MSNTASYIGKEPTYGVFITQTETGDGSTVAFSLDATANTPSSLLVSVGGVVQQPASAFNINSAGTTLTFTSAPGSSIAIWILFLGQTLTVPQASSANTTMITGETALGAKPAAGDYFLLYDADAASMKKLAYSNLETGDIENVIAGTGLSGGGTSGAVTLNVDAAQTQITSLGTIASLVATTADINAGTLDGVVGGTTPAAGTFTTLTANTSLVGTLGTAAQANITSLGTIASLVATTADINAGTFDGIVGGTTPAAVTTTALVATTADINAGTFDGIVGGTTPADGSFTTLSTTGTTSMNDGVLSRPMIKDYAETKVAMAAHAVDLTLGNVQTYTLSGNQTLTFTNPIATGNSSSFTLIVTNGGSATLTWPGSVDWAAATAPTLTSSGIDVLTFTTVDGGTIWYGFAAGLAMA